MKLKNEDILALGMISLTLGVFIGLISKYLDLHYLDFSISSFLEGLFFGLSLVLNLAYLIRRRQG
ncbi:MAG: hypothetical protein OEY88_08130 [Candidatus Bathyarchaeota archaeon]|nr:hypothetical protein [Candidatus Bathyarchaeota archaeon]